MTRKTLLILVCSVFLITMGCQTKERTGAAVGGAAGAGAGALLGGEEHRATGALLGGLLGGAVGYFAGTQLTEEDQENVYDVLENTPAGETESWTSESGAKYYVTPSEPFTEDGRIYRELDVRVEKPDGTEENVERVAYKPEGEERWQVAEAGTADELDRGRGYYDEEYERQERDLDREEDVIGPTPEEEQDQGIFE